VYISLSTCTLKYKMCACTLSGDEFASCEGQELCGVAPFDLFYFEWESKRVVHEI